MYIGHSRVRQTKYYRNEKSHFCRCSWEMQSCRAKRNVEFNFISKMSESKSANVSNIIKSSGKLQKRCNISIVVRRKKDGFYKFDVRYLSVVSQLILFFCLKADAIEMDLSYNRYRKILYQTCGRAAVSEDTQYYNMNDVRRLK